MFLNTQTVNNTPNIINIWKTLITKEEYQIIVLQIYNAYFINRINSTNVWSLYYPTSPKLVSNDCKCVFSKKL